MGIAGLFALLFNTLALMGQSGRSLLFGQRLDARVRSFTGYGLAAMLLAFGFFAAGVPVDNGAAENAGAETAVSSQVIVVTATYTPTAIGTAAANAADIRPSSGTPQTGAFVPLPTAASTGGDETATSETASITPSPNETAETTATPRPATATPTAAPTETPFPTMTATPIDGQTAVVTTQAGLTWLYESPGGQQAEQVFDGDVVILRGGHANRDGDVWQEVLTVNGRLGWIPEDFLLYDS